MEEKEKSKFRDNKNISLKNKKDNSNFIKNNQKNNRLKTTKVNGEKSSQKETEKVNAQKDINSKNLKKKMQANAGNNVSLQNTTKDNSNFQYTINKDNFNLQDSNKDNINFQATSKDNFNLKDTSNKDNIKFQTKSTDDFNFKEKSIDYINRKTEEKLEHFQNISEKEKSNDFKEKEKSNSKLKFKDEEKSKEFSKAEFEADLKNLKLDAKKFGLEFDKASVERKIRKNYGLKFREKEEIVDKNGISKTTNKLIFPRIEQKGFQYKDGLIRKTFYRASDFTRGKIHTEINKTENDNTTVQALHTSEKFIERKLINFKRNSNYRRIKKYNRLDRKISNIEKKQTINSLKVEFKDNKQAYKQSNMRQRNIYKKNMMKKVNKAKFTRRVQNIASNILNFKSNPLTYLLSFKGILISFVIFIVITVFLLISMTFQDGIGNIYEIQKAEIYYRELEANLEYNSGTRLDHDPIDLASFLVALFGEFEFDEEIETFLAEDVFQKHQQGKKLEQIISDFLPLSDYENYLYLYDVKCNFIKYGSPFAFEYEPYISSYVGYRINPTSTNTVLQLHKGLDIAVAGGTPILAISDGVVTRANYSESYGNIVEILHDDGWISKYAHQERLNVTQGQRVSQGDVIGYVGTTGDSTGNHLHLELYDELGEFMNPIYFIARDNERSDNDSD